MEKKWNVKWIGSGILAVILAVMAIYTTMTMAGTKDWLGLGINLLFLGIMAVMLFLVGQLGLGKMSVFGQDCMRIRQWIQQQDERMSAQELWEYISTYGIGFGDSFVNEKWKGYLSSKMRGDCVAYLDEEEIFEHCEKNYCDLVPGSLTALGILGTFLGLISSMSTFSTEGTANLGLTLDNIVGGMHVAFFTSVYGVALSIAYNLIYKHCQKSARENLYQLYDCLNQHFKGTEAKDANMQLVELTQEQQLQLETIEKLLRDEMAKIIGDRIGEAIQPAFEEINVSLKRVIGDFRQEQAAALQKIVDSFVTQVTKSLHSHINKLGQSVDLLSQSQSEMTEDMRKLLDEIGTTVRDTESINAVAESILKEFKIYLDKINEMMGVANQTFYSVENYSREMYHTSTVQHEIVKNLSEHEKQMIDACDAVRNIYENMVEASGNNTDLVRQMNEQIQVLTEAMNKYANGTLNVFAEMKAAQLAAAAQYQQCWVLLKQVIDSQAEAAVTQAQGQLPQNQTELLQLVESQAQALQTISSYIQQQEERRRNSLWNRAKEKATTLLKKVKKH